MTKHELMLLEANKIMEALKDKKSKKAYNELVVKLATVQIYNIVALNWGDYDFDVTKLIIDEFNSL